MSLVSVSDDIRNVIPEVRAFNAARFATDMSASTVNFVPIANVPPEIDVNFFEWKYYAPDTAQGAVIKKVCKLR